MSPTVGVIGGGQLARMMIPPAIALGVGIRVLAENAGDSAAIADRVIGDYRNAEEVLRFAQGVDVVTFDHEHVPQAVLRELEDAAVAIHPSPDALLFAQDKLLMRARLEELGMPVPEWAEVFEADELDEFVRTHGGRAVVKKPRGGYDGKGVRVVDSAARVADWLAADDSLLVEEFVPFRTELAQLVARRPSGESAFWPVVETIQRDGVCAEVIAPAPRAAVRMSGVAADLGLGIAEGLGVTGMLAVELFETTDDRLLVNELAMRPHNSGHWTIDGSSTSQFEQHLRAVLDLPLGATGSREPWSAMINILGGPTRGSFTDRYPLALADQPLVKFHHYGKQARPGRKVGHVTATGDDLADVVFRARAAAAFFED